MAMYSILLQSSFAEEQLVESKSKEEKTHQAYEGDKGPGMGKHVVFISGDRFYKSVRFNECDGLNPSTES